MIRILFLRQFCMKCSKTSFQRRQFSVCFCWFRWRWRRCRCSSRFFTIRTFISGIERFSTKFLSCRSRSRSSSTTSTSTGWLFSFSLSSSGMINELIIVIIIRVVVSC